GRRRAKRHGERAGHAGVHGPGAGRRARAGRTGPWSRLRFEVTEGEHAGKTVIRTWTFGPKALPYTKRALGAVGVTTSALPVSPFPEAGREYHVRLVVALQRGDDGIERNDVKRIDVLRVTDAPAAMFMLPDQGEGGAT